MNSLALSLAIIAMLALPATAAFAQSTKGSTSSAVIQTLPMSMGSPVTADLTDVIVQGRIEVYYPEIGEHPPLMPVESGEYLEPDHDRDGQAAAPLGRDCDDNDRSAYHGNPEVVDPTFTDNDCDPWTMPAIDEDRDGFNSHASMQFLRTGAGRVVAVMRGADCVDSDQTIHPMAPDVAGDGIDNNCDGFIDNPPVETGYCAPVLVPVSLKEAIACHPAGRGDPAVDADRLERHRRWRGALFQE